MSIKSRQPTASTSTHSSSQPTTADVHLLIQHVARAFYDTRQTVLLDQMVAGEPAIRDEALAAKLGVPSKEVKKAAQPLVAAQDRELMVFDGSVQRNEVREGQTKATARTWFYLDLKTFIDVVKWKMYKIRKTIEDQLRDEVKTQGYDCPLCKKSFSTLDVMHLDVSMEGFNCDVCGTLLRDNESAVESELGKTKIRRLLDQCKHVLAGLKKTENITLPAFDVKKWLDINHPVQESASKDKTDGLKVATGSGLAAAFKVEMANADDILASQARLEAEAEAKRQQYALPSWIARSTISGALTEAGAKEAKADAAAAAAKANRAATDNGHGGSDSALQAYYSKLEAEASQAAMSRSTSTLEATMPEDSDDDEVFEAVSTHHEVTPPTSIAQDLAVVAKPLFDETNENGKRSREPTEDSEEQFEDVEMVAKKPKLENTSEGDHTSLDATAPISLDLDSDDEDFEEI